MEVVRASTLGFCSGVKLALDIARDAISEAKMLSLPCYVYGDIVHNSFVIERMKSIGIKRISSIDDCPSKGIVIIRTHGIEDSLRNSFIESGFIIRDATCPVVLKNQRLIRESDKPIIVFGLSGHSEVVSLVGAIKESLRDSSLIIDSAEKLEMVSPNIEYNAIVQTTFSTGEFDRIKKKIKEKCLFVEFLNDICSSSRLRRESIVELKDKVDAVAVVGDKKSANTNELVSIAQKNGIKAFLVESVDNIPSEMLEYARIGLTAGASTPSSVYNAVQAYLDKL